MIEAHPRFSAPQMLRVPARYCGTADGVGIDPDRDVNRVRAMQNARIISTTHRPATGDECRNSSAAARELYTVSITDVGANFHPTSLGEGRGWTFEVARRVFGSVHEVNYDNPDDPKLAHVSYVWHWEPNLLGQLMQLGSVEQGASATFLRDGNGWIVRQPGM